jgi:tetratricopeptide (TPR) repeat protein
MWMRVVAVLVVAHILSSMFVYPHEMAYANMAWGGPANTHNLLSDANVDWAQQLYQVKAWQDRNPNVPCWFAYFARPEVDPAVYGIRCHALPNLDTWWLGGSEVIPPVVHGAVIISAGDLSGCEWPSDLVNPYRSFQKMKPSEVIDYSVFVYRGDLHLEQAAALSRAEAIGPLLAQHQTQQALTLAQQAVAIDPGDLFAETALGDTQAAMGHKPEALAAWNAALVAAHKLSPEAQVSYVPDLQRKIREMEASGQA